MANMSNYFQSQVGKKITKTFNTNNNFFTEVWERVYTIEVLEVDEGKLTVELNSYDKVPSGYKSGGTDKYHGEFTVNMGSKSKAEIIDDLAVTADPNFFIRYPKLLNVM